MNISQLHEKLFDHWKEKLCCFIVAIFVYCVFQLQQFDRLELQVPLEIRDSGNLTLKSGFVFPEYVTVRIRAERDSLSGVSADNISAFIDLTSQSREGTYEYRVVTRPNLHLARLRPLEISVEPEFVSLSVEDKIVRYVPVMPTISGQPHYGYECGVVTVNPTSIEVKGPRTAVEGLSEIQTEEVNIDGATVTNSKEVGIMNLNSITEIASDAKVAVTVTVLPIGVSKTFKSLPVAFENINDSLEITNTAFTVDITVDGNQLTLDKVKANSFVAEADCSLVNEPGVFDVPVFIFAPENVSVVSQSIESITVTAVEKIFDDSQDSISENYR